MLSKTDQLNKLFDQWEQAIPEYNNTFIRDGIVNEKLYSGSFPKILILNLEPKFPSKEPVDLRQWYIDEEKSSYFFRIAELSFGILNNFPPFDKIDNSREDAYGTINQIAFVSLRKSVYPDKYGLYDDIMKRINLEVEFINRQIEIISPNIILGYFNWSSIRKALFPNVDFQNTGYVCKIGRYENAKILAFDSFSPSSSHVGSYCHLQTILNTALFKYI